VTKHVVNEEKMLSNIFVKLEYSDTFQDFIMNLSKEEYEALSHAVKTRDLKESNAGSV